jgi:hypothetical protein
MGHSAHHEARLGQQSRTTGVVALVFGVLMPGAGHIYLTRRARGILFLGAIGALFVLGVAMQARLEIRLGLDDPLGSLLSVAQVAAGVPYLLARILGYDMGDPKAVTFEYGNTFTAVAGLLNVLVALDAFDIGVGRKR